MRKTQDRVNKHKPWIETSYHGVITENNDTVILDPPLVALDKDAPVPFAGEICAFKIHGQELPFEAVVLNKTSGEGRLRAKSPIDCELQKEYTFIIQAYDCGVGPRETAWKKSHKAVVHIQVKDVNEFAPTFKEPAYRAVVTEGKIYDSILQVEAVDEDCSPQYSQICNYEIITTDVPFAIDKNGNIRNTEKLSYDKQRQYEILVTAYDCGQKPAAQDTLVQVDVKPVCKPGWQDWTKRIEYQPGSGSMPLFPSIHLETCDGAVSSIQITTELQTNYIGKGCDRETYSERSLQKLCGASSGIIDLLPSPSAATNWTAGLLVDSSEMIFQFDGRQGAKIPDEIVPKNLTDQFTITMWMKHGPSPGVRAEKETILCNSDKTEMNRHHYALYVHNCRLVFLLRKDFDQADTFRPAEFHWKLDQICDKEWHYYVINVEFPVVTLYMDGATYEPYLVTNDWPIHPSHIAMQLTVGACWQGGEVTKPRFAQFFHGSLASLTIRPGKMESQKVISCLQACKEGLDINSLESLGQGIKYHFNPSQSVLVMEGDDIGNINRALQKVSYINSRQFPTAGVRRLRVSSKVQCFGEDVCISVPDMDAYVMVLQAIEPQISLRGTDHLWRPTTQFESARGVTLFPDLKIVSTFAKAEAPGDLRTTAPKSAVLEEMLHNLDFCDILVLGGDLDPRQECLELNHSELHQRHLDATNSTAGYSIYGVGSMSRYEQVLHHIRYRNWHPGSLETRRFRIKCSELNGRYTSNEFNLEVSVLREARVSDKEHVNHLIVQPPFLQSVHHPESQGSIQHSSVVPSIATVVIIISVCMLVFVVAMGVYRVRIAHQHFTQEAEAAKEAEMDWDDSALTITVNPMEKHEEPGHGEEETEEEEEEEVEEDVSSSSSESEDSEEEEEEEGVGRGRHGQSGARHTQLEWDDSALPY
ncbi:calsyntenin-2 isoform X2 [Zalophus californianus]|uniref:Calsyntenin-2 n=1 Tax=Zalophus californianus TaxID=9704 RepID=A0A6J2CEN7_ZALCA|nr:calsyntenin-2 isoform X2 [Zalophus californianus]XP_027440522.2 calsyntenin-2 isoform X2 [Zalophus californianus]XP_027440523.2 calsyntenin-2 isoform X2 [Zalophus californianus]